MSSPSEYEHDNLNPNDPSYYAPRWLRDRSEAPFSSSYETISEMIRGQTSPPASLPASLETQLEDAVSNALWYPLDPEVIHEPPGFADEDRRAALINVAGRFAAAVGVSAIVALFFVIMVPASRLPEGGDFSGFLHSIKSVLLQPGQQDDGSKPAIAEFQPILAAAQPSRPAQREPSEQLLQQFLQWREKPNSTETSQ
jgi:hypothetical protein